MPSHITPAAPAVAVAFLTRREVADLLRCSITSIDGWRRTEGLPAVRLGPRRLVFDRLAVLAWAAARSSSPVSA